MTSEREAKCWMLAAGAVVVWACTMVGCAGSPMSDRSAMPLHRPAATPIAPTYRAVEMPVTLSSDTVAPGNIPGNITGSDDAWGGGWWSATSAPESAGVFIPIKIDVDGFAPQGIETPRLDVDLRGLSIAQPLVLAQRLLIAAASLEPATRDAGEEVVSFDMLRPHVSERPLAALATLAPRWVADDSAAAAAAGLLSVAVLDRSAVLPTPWSPDPAPTPATAAMIPIGEAKFDSAGVLAIVLGGMVLLFGGEAVVMLMINRRRRAQRAVVKAVEADEAEESIFRFPEPITLDDEPAESFSRAA